MSEERSKDVDHAYTQLDAALCLRSVAIGEQRKKQYFYEVSPTVRRVLIDDKVYVMTLVLDPDEKAVK